MPKEPDDTLEIDRDDVFPRFHDAGAAVVESLERARGFVAAVVLNATNGETIFARATTRGVRPDQAVNVIAEFIRTVDTAIGLNSDDEIVEICATVGEYFHISVPMSASEPYFLYAVFDANEIAMALVQRKVQAAIDRLGLT